MRNRLRCYHWVWLALLAKLGLDMLGTWIKKKRAKSIKKPTNRATYKTQDFLQGIDRTL